MKGGQNTSSGHQIGHISTIFSCNLHKFSTKNKIWNQTQHAREQNPYSGHQIGCISTIFSCNYIKFQQELKFDTKFNKLGTKLIWWPPNRKNCHHANTHFHNFLIKTWISIQIQHDYLMISKLLKFQAYFN